MPIINGNTNTPIDELSNSNGNTNSVTIASGGSDARTSAPDTGSAGTEDVCRPPQIEEFITSDTRENLAAMCQDPLVLQQILGISPRITYDMKFAEYTFLGLVQSGLPENLDTIGIRDSDTDGLSDVMEVTAGTDPFYWDTDRDSYTDGEEVLTYGTDPLDPKSRTDGRSILITNIKDGMVTTDTRPVIAGIATPASLVEVREGAGSGTLLLGTTRTDAKGKFLLVPTVDLAPGDHTVQASEITEAGNVIITSPRRSFTVQTMLAITPPEITRIETKADCHRLRHNLSAAIFMSLTVSRISLTLPPRKYRAIR